MAFYWNCDLLFGFRVVEMKDYSEVIAKFEEFYTANYKSSEEYRTKKKEPNEYRKFVKFLKSDPVDIDTIEVEGLDEPTLDDSTKRGLEKLAEFFGCMFKSGGTSGRSTDYDYEEYFIYIPLSFEHKSPSFPYCEAPDPKAIPRIRELDKVLGGNGRLRLMPCTTFS